MNRDLESALGELAARAQESHRSTRAPLPADLLTARVRRTRRHRVALAATGAAAATVVVAGAAFALLPDRAPAPPAISPTPSVTVSPTPTRTPTPTPTPTAVPVVLPVGDPTLPFGACGSLLDAAPSHPADERVRAPLTPDATTVAAGGWVPAGGIVESDAPAVAVPDDGPRVAVVQGGVVVGTTGFSAATADLMSASAVSFRGVLDLTVCDPGDGGATTVGRPLPAGTYELHPWAAVVVYDGRQEAPTELSQGSLTFEQAAALGGTRATALGAATTVTVTGDAETQLPRPGADAPLDRTTFASVPVCDAPPPAAPVRSAMIDLQVSPGTTTLSAGSGLHATGSATYTGPGRLRVYGYYALEYWVVRDGVVVGATVLANDAFAPMDLGAGAPVLFPDAERVLTSCTGEPLPAGRYTVYPGWIFNAPVVRTPTETVELDDPGDSYSLTLGTPFTVTLT